jgi:hypothetical protein
MQDPRALANPRNLESYRAWSREGVWRSGFGAVLGIVMLTPWLSLAAIVFRPAMRDHDAGLVLIGGGFALYLAAALELMLFAVLRLNAWRRAHPWEPPRRRNRPPPRSGGR